MKPSRAQVGENEQQWMDEVKVEPRLCHLHFIHHVDYTQETPAEYFISHVPHHIQPTILNSHLILIISLTAP